jgi:hypothetical protein
MTPSERLAEMTWRWVDGERETVLAWLARLGGQLVPCGEGTWAGPGPSGLAGGLEWPAPDPLGVAIALAFLVLGPLWPHVVPKALDLVNAEWRRRRTAARQEGRRAR